MSKQKVVIKVGESYKAIEDLYCDNGRSYKAGHIFTVRSIDRTDMRHIQAMPDGENQTHALVRLLPYDFRRLFEDAPPQTYSLAEVRNGTGWPKGARFMLVQEVKS